jgi:hypothetical protein
VSFTTALIFVKYTTLVLFIKKVSFLSYEALGDWYEASRKDHPLQQERVTEGLSGGDPPNPPRGRRDSTRALLHMGASH